MHIKDILLEKECEICSITPQEGVHDAVMLMAERNMGSILVMEKNRMVGILTKQDIVSALRQKGNNLTQFPVAAVMSTEVLICSPEDSIDYALHIMNQNHICYLPVVEEGKVCAVVSMWDLMKASIDSYQFENRLLKRYIQTWPDERRGVSLKLVVNNKFRHSTETSEMG